MPANCALPGAVLDQIRRMPIHTVLLDLGTSAREMNLHGTDEFRKLVAYLLEVARRTWKYFDTFVTSADNHLPPDNVQIGLTETIAHRTSPTNIGLYLLSAACARELGLITAADLAERLTRTLDTLERLPRHHGHFLNWIDTQTLAVLPPRYVSTVDSGNLAVSLLTLRQGCMEAVRAPMLSPKLWDGFDDAINLLREALSVLPEADRRNTSSCRQPPVIAAVTARLTRSAVRALSVAISLVQAPSATGP